MVLDPDTKRSLSEIVNYEKARSVLFGQWGFDKKMQTQGVTCCDV